MSKKGISAVVATVLIILITVAGVAIIWVGVLPILRESLVFEELEGRVSVVGTGGYTVYDSSRGIASVQVKRDVDEGVMDRIRVNFIVGGNSVGSNVIAPDSGQTRVYNFDLSTYGTPDSVEVAPIFISSGGKEKEGSISSKVDMPTGVISDVDGVVYGLGVDVVSDVPTDGLVSMWTFSGDADDGVGGNDGVVFGEGDELVDGVLILDGAGDYVDVPDDDSLDGLTELTICAWFNTVSSSDGVIVRKSGYEWLLYKTASSIVSFYVDEDGVSAWSAYISGSSIVNDGSWHHSCGVYNGASDLKIYFDGVSEGTIVGTEPVNLYSSNDVWSIGGYLGTSNFFAGSIDDIMIYNKALSEAEILVIYGAQKK